MQVKSIEECSKGGHCAILWTFFKLPVVVKNFVLVYFWVAVIQRFYCKMAILKKTENRFLRSTIA